LVFSEVSGYNMPMTDTTFPSTPEEYEEYCAVMEAIADEAAASISFPQPQDFN
jgi:hypothetical protein